jgi:hypothetical protein
MKNTLIMSLADPEELDAFIMRIADQTGHSTFAVLASFTQVLACQQRKRSDDLAEVLSIGRVRQTVAAALDCLLDTST